MSPARVPHPRRKQPPEYVLQRISLDGSALFYGRDGDGEMCWSTEKRKAQRMRGAGLESAVRALNRRGYIVERIPA